MISLIVYGKRSVQKVMCWMSSGMLLAGLGHAGEVTHLPDVSQCLLSLALATLPVRINGLGKTQVLRNKLSHGMCNHLEPACLTRRLHWSMIMCRLLNLMPLLRQKLPRWSTIARYSLPLVVRQSSNALQVQPCHKGLDQ